MRKHHLLLALFAFLFAAHAKADFIIAPYGGDVFEPTKRTHVVVVSRGNDLGLAPQLSAITKILKLHDVYPTDQIVLFTHAESEGNLKWLKRSGFPQAAQQPVEMAPKVLFDQITAYSQLVSIHTYGHSAIIEGPYLGANGDRDIRLYPSSGEFKRLVGHFTADAFVTLNGCNLAHQLAPMLSSLWQVPVSGAMVGTHFEVLMANGFFAPLGAAESKWSKSATIFSNPQNCVRGCFRMRPDNANYNGHYGKYSQGLSFYKFFCHGIDADACDRGMARSIFSEVTEQPLGTVITDSQYLAVVREWLCPIGHRADRFVKDACMSKLAEVDLELETKAVEEIDTKLRSYTPFFGRTASCDMHSCYKLPKCTKTFQNAQACAQVEMPKPGASTLVDEYLHYRRGLALLRASSL